MNRFFRAIIAAWGASRLGGGCLSTIVIFIIIYSLLGKCNHTRGADLHKAPKTSAVVCRMK